MNARSLVLAASLVLGMVGCAGAPGGEPGGGDPGAGEVKQGLTFQTRTDSELVGTFTDGVVILTFSSRAIADDVYQARLSTGPRAVEFTYKGAAGEVEYSGGVAFDAEEVEAIKAFEIALGVIRDVDAEKRTKPESTLVSLSTLASESAPGEMLPHINKLLERSWVDIGCGNVCRTLYGSSICGQGGKTFYLQTGINSPNCKGRCGAGCGNARTGGSNTWTMDCAEHDYHIGPLSDCTDDATLDGNHVKCGYSGGEWCASNCGCQPIGGDCY